MQNKILFYLDYTLFLPITIIRLIFIYLYGSRYNIDGMEVFDIMTHADQPYFNQEKDKLTVDTMGKNIQQSVYDASIITDYNDDFNNKKYSNDNLEKSNSNKNQEIESQKISNIGNDIQSNSEINTDNKLSTSSNTYEFKKESNKNLNTFSNTKPTTDNEKIKSILDIINKKMNNTDNNISTSDILNTEFSNDITEYSDDDF